MHYVWSTVHVLEFPLTLLDTGKVCNMSQGQNPCVSTQLPIIHYLTIPRLSGLLGWTAFLYRMYFIPSSSDPCVMY